MKIQIIYTWENYGVRFPEFYVKPSKALHFYRTSSSAWLLNNLQRKTSFFALWSQVGKNYSPWKLWPCFFSSQSSFHNLKIASLVYQDNRYRQCLSNGQCLSHAKKKKSQSNSKPILSQRKFSSLCLVTKLDAQS